MALTAPAGLRERDAHLLRYGRRARQRRRLPSLIIPHKLLGTREWFVIHHCHCGMELFTDDIIRNPGPNGP